jgi:hypothetical protein
MYDVVASLGLLATNARIFILCWGRFAWFFATDAQILMYDVVASLGVFRTFAFILCHKGTNFITLILNGLISALSSIFIFQKNFD